MKIDSDFRKAGPGVAHVSSFVVVHYLDANIYLGDLDLLYNE